ncbi:pyruvate kinase [Tindallia californiensis]|uniref:Pyruvate kinase n=1 Tax=Tindallia californiensis TaxID=159292 RepID=A0A1H3K1V6_9FIRM|nr:pyruvate kinase [Tindallia californiensis]SDY45588.1 pyruvate kinase [Tindallia californiensis]
MKKTKIVCTIGPASERKDVFEALVNSGLNVARLNFSHGTHQEHQARIDVIKEVRREIRKPIAILLDTKGPEIRTGSFQEPSVQLEEGQEYILTTREVEGTKEICSVSYKALAQDVKPGDTILIDDGLVSLRVKEIKDQTDIYCRVENAGEVKNHKGVNVPSVKINLPAITDKDKADIEFGIKNGIDFIAASFVRKARDVLAIREILEENNAEKIKIISKIENQEGIDNLAEIIEASDGIMVARGDLGVEIPTEEIPLAQKDMIRRCNRVGKPVITATQMLDSMIRNPRPTRAEATDVANAILDGTDAIMLSGETAAGKYPVEAVQMMTQIAMRTEASINYRDLMRQKANDKETSMTDAISDATTHIAMDLDAAAIITATSSGHTARMVSKFRPSQLVIAATTDRQVTRQLALSWGTYAVLTEYLESTDDIIDTSIAKALECNLIERGDLVVITAGVPVGIAGTTNLIKAHIVGEVIVNGTGIGSESYTGTVKILTEDPSSWEKLKEGDVLVSEFTDAEMVPVMEKAGALIVEAGGLTSHAAVIGLNIHTPTVVGAHDATKTLKDGDIVTVDTARGQIYSGRTKVL